MPSGSPKRSVQVRVFPTFRPTVKAPFVRKAAKAALAAGDPQGVKDVSVVIADDETLRDLNLRYRGFDEPTDVLSFGDTSDASLAPPDADEGPAFPDLPEESGSLGEILLSYPLAVRQAGEHNVRVEEEVALLIVHGVLHLLGHDHAEPNEEAAMKALENRALTELFPERAANPGGAR
ncbi:MAG: rRNA maturation RNase YbeY [Chloroflexi bacterium]|nr:rRNA maturation RNase YbeY [Chloroflexota bacterium]